MSEPAPGVPDFTTSQLIDSYYQGLKEAVDFVQSQIVPVLSGQINLSKQEGAVMGIFYRIHALAHSLVRLNNRVDFNAVAIIARTMLELVIDLKLLARSDITEKELDQFFSFPDIDHFRVADQVNEFQKEHPELHDQSLLDSSMRQEFVRSSLEKGEVEGKLSTLWNVSRAKGLRRLYHWSGLSVRKRAERLGPLYEQKYLEDYSILSWYTHGGNSAYFGFSERALESVYGIFLEYARKLYIESLLICSKVFHLRQAIEGFSQVITFLREAPSKLLVEYGLRKADEAKDSDST